jgi:site-specific DNA-methyltransferase (adenine-specific)
VGEGLILDPFMGSGSTVAAAESLGLRCVGVERFFDYFEIATTAVGRLASLQLEGDVDQLALIDDLDVHER